MAESVSEAAYQRRARRRRRTLLMRLRAMLADVACVQAVVVVVRVYSESVVVVVGEVEGG